MWKINICKIPCLNTSGILPGNTTFSYHKNKIMITYGRKHTLECTILSSLLLMKRLIRVEVLLVILVGSVITCVNWYTSRILMRCLIWESPGLNRLQQLISPVMQISEKTSSACFRYDLKISKCSTSKLGGQYQQNTKKGLAFWFFDFQHYHFLKIIF